MNEQTEITRLSDLRQNFSVWFRDNIKSLRKIIFVSLVVAWILAMLTTNLSSIYFAEISVIATGRRTSQEANAAVVWIATPKIVELKRDFAIQKSAGWEEVNGIFVSNKNQPAELRLKGYVPRNLMLQFFRTRYSGEVRLVINGDKLVLNLFSEKPGVERIPLGPYLSEEKRSVMPVFFSHVNAIVKNFLWLMLCGIVLRPIYRKLPTPRVSPANLISASSKQHEIYLLLLALGIFALFTAAFYPGTLNPDAYWQYTQAVLFQFADWHPPIMSVLWSLLNKFVAGSGGMFVLHLMMGLGSFYLLCRVALHKGKRQYFLPMLAILLPIVSCLIFDIIKDVSSAFGMLLSFSLWYFWRSTGRLTKPKFILILIVLFYGSSVRFNALPAVIPLLFLFLSDLTSRKKALVFSLLIAGLFHASNNFVVYRILNTEKLYPFQAVMSHNLMGIYKITGKNYFPTTYLKKDHLDLLMKRYDPRNLMPTFNEVDPYRSSDSRVISELKQAWIMAILKEPKAYLLHRWILYKSFLTDVNYIIHHVSDPEEDFSPYPAYSLMKETSLGILHTDFVYWVFDHYRFVFRAWTYLIAACLLLIISLRLGIASGVALNLSAIFYVAPYFFVASIANYRYVYWCVLSTLVSIFVLWIETRRRSNADALLPIEDLEAEYAEFHLKELLQVTPPSGKMLLIGPRISEFATLAEKRGFEVHRVSALAPEFVQGNGSQYELCVLLDTMDFATDLNQVFQQIRNNLVTSALFFLVTPTTDVPNKHAHNSGQVFFFNRQNLHSLLLKSGFGKVLTFPENHCSGNVWTMTTICRKGELPRKRERLSIVVPVYNERPTFSQMMEHLLQKELENVDKEIIVVESNSTDGTREEVQKLQGYHNVRLIFEEKPRGKGHAVRAGLREATGDIILIQDADLEYDVNDYGDLLQPLLKYERMFVLGSRHTGHWKVRTFGSKKTLSAYVNFGHVLFTSLINILHGCKLKDPFTMYKVFRKDCLNGLTLESDGFDLDWEIVIKLLRKKYIPLEVPVSYKSRSFTEGKKIHLLKDPLRGLRALVKYRFSRFRLNLDI